MPLSCACFIWCLCHLSWLVKLGLEIMPAWGQAFIYGSFNAMQLFAVHHMNHYFGFQNRIGVHTVKVPERSSQTMPFCVASLKDKTRRETELEGILWFCRCCLKGMAKSGFMGADQEIKGFSGFCGILFSSEIPQRIPKKYHATLAPKWALGCFL